MKLMKFTLFIGLTLLLASCTKEFGTTKVTYTKATPIYKTASEVRNQVLNSSAPTIENIGKVFVGENYLLIGDENKGIHIIDNSDQSNPQEVNFLNIPGNYDFYVENNTLYANNYFDLVKLDISDMRNARVLQRNESALIKDESIKFGGGDTESLLVGFEFERVTEEVDHDTKLWDYISDGQNTIYFDYADEVIPPSSIPTSFVGNSSGQSGTTNRFIVKEDKMYILTASGIDEYNAQLEELKSTRVPAQGLETIFERNDHIYIGSQSAMLVYSVENDQLVHKGTFRHQIACDPVLPVSDDIAYVTTRAGGTCPGDENILYVVSTDLRTGSFSEAQIINMLNPFGMALSQDMLFVAEGDRGLTIFDATTRSNLKMLKRHSNIVAYDVLPHPTRTDVILIASGDKIDQYLIGADGKDYDFMSSISL